MSRRKGRPMRAAQLQSLAGNCEQQSQLELAGRGRPLLPAAAAAAAFAWQPQAAAAWPAPNNCRGPKTTQMGRRSLGLRSAPLAGAVPCARALLASGPLSGRPGDNWKSLLLLLPPPRAGRAQSIGAPIARPAFISVARLPLIYRFGFASGGAGRKWPAWAPPLAT